MLPIKFKFYHNTDSSLIYTAILDEISGRYEIYWKDSSSGEPVNTSYSKSAAETYVNEKLHWIITEDLTIQEPKPSELEQVAGMTKGYFKNLSVSIRDGKFYIQVPELTITDSEKLIKVMDALDEVMKM